MIDELIQHCIHEIGSDGEAGSELDRLRHFVLDFHAQQSADSHLARQNVDDSYQAFVLKKLLRHPDVHLGLHTPGVPSKHVKKSNITRKSENNGVATKAESVTAPSLEFDWVDLLPPAQQRLHLYELQQRHSDKLRVVLSAPFIKRLLLGSGDYGLSTPNYRFLQLVCRARQHAVKSVDLGTIMRYDQKTIFYLAKKLIDLNLIAKIKAPETGTTASYFVATKYMHQCPLLLDQQNADIATDRDTRIPLDTTADADQDQDGEPDADAPAVKVEQGETELAPPQFESVSPDKALLWVSSRPELVRLRIYLLCRQTSSKITARIGLTKRIRIEGGTQLKRPMNGMLERAIVDGYLEVVRVFLSNSASNDSGYKGLRMTAKGEAEMQALLDGTSADPQQQQLVAEAQKRNARMSHELAMREPRLVREVTLERWLHEEVANAGSQGKSLKQLASSIHASGHVHRMLEGIIQRSDEAVSDTSMADLRIRSVHEHNLRVRSTRFFSHHAWVLQCANEGYLQPADRDLLQAAGGVSAVHEQTSSYDTVQQLSASVSALASDLYDSSPKKKSGARLGRPPGSTKKRAAEEGPATPARRGRPPKKAKTDPPATPSAPSVEPMSEDATAPPSRESPQTPLVNKAKDTVVIEDDDMGDLAPNQSSIDDLLQGPVKQETAPMTPAPKAASSLLTPRSASDRKMKTNLTRLRSAHAIVDCIKQAGGAMDSLLIPKQLLAYVEQHGYAADSQLLNLREKRIRDRALSAAIDDDLLRRTYIRLDKPDAHQPKRQIVYLPDLPVSKLQEYCNAVLAGREGWTLDKTNNQTALMHVTEKVELDFTDALRLTDRKPWHGQDAVSVDQLPTEPGLLATLRGHFMGVSSVLGQHVGYLGGPMLRLKTFHIACAQLIVTQHPSTTLDPPAVQLSYFWTQAPLDLYLALVSVRSPTQAAETAFLDANVRSRPVQELTGDVSVALRLTPSTMSEVKTVFYSLASQLADLGIITVPSTDEESKMHTIQLKQHLPLFDWSTEDDEKSLIEVMDVGLSLDQINLFWAKTQKHCLKRKLPTLTGTADTTAASESVQRHQDEELVRKAPEELRQTMTTVKAWRPFNLLRPSQTRFLERIDLASMRREDGTFSPDALAHLAYICLAPVAVVTEYLQARNVRTDGAANESRASIVNQNKWPLKLSAIEVPTDVFVPVAPKAIKAPRGKAPTESERDKQGRLTTLKKARELRQRREAQFQDMVEQAFALAPGAEVLREKIERALRGIRKRFVSGDARFSNAEEVRKAIHRAVGSGAGVKIKMPSVRSGPNGTAADVTLAGKQRQQRTGRRSFVPTNYWNVAKNELLRDAVVILRARDRARGRSDWSALMQIVDAADQTKARSFVLGQWRNQYHRMRFQYGEEGYLSALERKWAALSAAARASGELADPSFPSATDFDLNAQIAFLRAHTDKNEIQSSLAKPATKDPLPLKLTAENDFTRGWQHEFPAEDGEKKWEVFFSNELGMSARRFEVLLANAFGVEASETALVSPGTWEEQEQVLRARMAEIAVRIVISTEDGAPATDGENKEATPVPNSAMEQLKTTFCDNVGGAEIEAAVVRLLESKLIRTLTTEVTSRRRPGTNFAFTDEYLRLLPESSSAPSGSKLALSDLQQTLISKHDMLADASRHWLVEPVETDGDAAALVTLIDLDGGLVQATLDTRPFAALRQHHAFNARVLNDDELEALITVQARLDCAAVIEASTTQVPPLPQGDPVLYWLEKSSPDEWRAEFDAQLAQNSSQLTQFRNVLADAGPLGLPLSTVATQLKYDDLLRLVGDTDKPLAFFSPTAHTPTLVASVYIRHYTLAFPDTPRRQLPHLWTSLTTPSFALWARLLDHLVGFVVQRPGTNVAHLAARFAARLSADTPAVVGVSFTDVYQAVQCLVDRGVLELEVLGASADPARWILHLRPHTASIWTGFSSTH